MSEMKHTRGPWKPVVNSSDYWVVVHPWPDQSFEEANPYSPTVVHVCTKEGAEQEANARLIAAAPELLEALQAAKNTLVAFKFQPGEANCWEHHDEENLAMVDAAIAKATGGQP